MAALTPAEIQRSSNVPAGHASVLLAVYRLVSNVEQHVAQADSLLKRSRYETLTAAEWKGLADLIASARQDLWAFESQWDDRLAGLPEGHALSPAHAETVGTLRQRLDDARSYLCSDDMPWERTIRRIEIRLPWGRPETVVVDSRVVPGSALGASLAQGYPAAAMANPDSLARYLHPPGLEQTVLTNAEDQTLYSGLRHHIFRSDDLSFTLLSAISDVELHNLILDLYLCESSRAGLPERSFNLALTDIATVRQDIRHGHEQARRHIEFFQFASRYRMAKEAALAALVADPQKLQRALIGEPVQLDLFFISLETPLDDMDGYKQRVACLRWNRNDVKFELRGSDGWLHTASAGITARTFKFMGTGTGPLFRGRSADEFHRLIGPGTTELPGSPVESRIDFLRARARQLRAEAATSSPACIAAVQQLGVDHPQALPIVNRVSRLGNEIQLLERNARTLQQSAEHLQALSQASQFVPADARTHKRAAALLALVAHLMGGTPILSCARDTNFTAELGAEISFLATLADRRDGHLPYIARSGENWGPAISQFQPH